MNWTKEHNLRMKGGGGGAVIKYAGINKPVQVSVFMQSCQRSSENVRYGSNCECVRVYIWGMKYVINNAVNMLLNISLIPLQRKKIRSPIRSDGAFWIIINHE